MKTCIAIIFVAVAGFAWQHDNADFKKLYLLEGVWIMPTKKGAIGEEWKKIGAGYLQSRGFKVLGKDTIVEERVALKNSNEGIIYTSTVENQNNRQPVSFKLIRSADQTFVFANPQHDYPKRITYHFITKDSLDAWIDDGTDLPEKRSAFHYRRQK